MEIIEEAVIVEETGVSVLGTEFEKPSLPLILNKEDSLAKIAEAFKKYSEIEIKDTSDKENYNLVVAGIKEFKDSRIAWDKSVSQNLSAPAKEWYNSLNSDVKAIIEAFKTNEEILRNKKDAIDNKKKEEKAEDDRKKLAILGKRIEQLVALGGKSDGTKYTFDYDLSLSINITAVKDLEEDKWTLKLTEITEAYKEEKQRVADEKIASDKLVLANQSLAGALADKQKKLRIKELLMNDFVADFPTGDSYSRGSQVVEKRQIESATDEEWDAIIDYVPSNEPAPVLSTDALPWEQPASAPSAIQPSTSFTSVDQPEKDDNDMNVVMMQDNAEMNGELPNLTPEALSDYSINLKFTEEKPSIEFTIGNNFKIVLYNKALENKLPEINSDNSEEIEGNLWFALIQTK